MKKDQKHSSFTKEDVMTVSVIFIFAMCLLGANILTKEERTTKKAYENKIKKEHKRAKREFSGNKEKRV